MASIQSQAITALLANPIITDVVEDRVLPIPLKKGGNGATPTAYDEYDVVLPSLVVLSEGSVDDATSTDARHTYLVVWMHGPDTVEAREALDAIVPAIVTTIKTAGIMGYNGTGTDIAWADQFGLRENPTEVDEVLDYLRFQIATIGV